MKSRQVILSYGLVCMEIQNFASDIIRHRACIYDNCTLHTASGSVSLDYQAVTNILDIRAGSSVWQNSGGRRRLRSACLSQSADSVLNGANRAEFENKYRISQRTDIYMLQQRCWPVADGGWVLIPCILCCMFCKVCTNKNTLLRRQTGRNFYCSQII